MHANNLRRLFVTLFTGRVGAMVGILAYLGTIGYVAQIAHHPRVVASMVEVIILAYVICAAVAAGLGY